MPKCKVCHDRGWVICPDCGGRGKKDGGFLVGWVKCKHCGGTGRVNCAHK